MSSPLLLALWGDYAAVPPHLKATALMGVETVLALSEPISDAYQGCIIVAPRRPTTPEERFRVQAWIDTMVQPRLPSGVRPVIV